MINTVCVWLPWLLLLTRAFTTSGLLTEKARTKHQVIMHSILEQEQEYIMSHYWWPQQIFPWKIFDSILYQPHDLHNSYAIGENLHYPAQSTAVNPAVTRTCRCTTAFSFFWRKVVCKRAKPPNFAYTF